MISIEISDAHGKAIESRKMDLEVLRMQFSVILREDKRHVDAVIRTAGYNPEDYGEYNLVAQNGFYLLSLTRKAGEVADAPQQTVHQTTNGMAQPESHQVS